MQRIVYVFGQFSANTVHFHEVIDSRTRHALQSTELAQQFPAFFWPQPWNLFQS